MSANRGFLPWLRWWWPALLMMALIFIISTDLGAMSHQSRILGPLMQALGFSPETAIAIVVAIRKSGHASGYAVLAILFWRAVLRRGLWAAPRWPLSRALVPLVLSALYAASDEFHQSFVPTRTASVDDVLLDTAGAAAGLLVVWIWHYWRGRGE